MMLLPWLAGKNLYAAIVLVAVGGMIVTGIFRAGVKYERGNTAAETASINKVIVEDRGKDEAEIAAQEKAAETVDAAVKTKLKQTLILDAETAQWLGLVK